MKYVIDDSYFNRILIRSLNVFLALPIFLGVAVFGGKCWDRSWLMYPNFNHLSWAYGLAVVSFFFHVFAAIFLFLVS